MMSGCQGSGLEEVSAEEVTVIGVCILSEDLLMDQMWVVREESGVIPRFPSLNI